MLINKIRKILQFASVLIIVGSFLFFKTQALQAAFIGDYNKPASGTLSAPDWNNLKVDFLNKDGDAFLNGNLTLPNTKSVIAGFFQGTTNALYVSSGTFGGPGGGNYSFPGNLNVDGNINFNGDLYQNGSLFVTSKWLSNGNKIYYNDGNVGIGKSDPLFKLDVDGNANFSGTVDGNTPGTTQKDAFTTVAYIDDFISGVSTSTVGFWSKLGDNIYNANTGNVGIGTSNPTSLITIANNKWLSAISSNGSSGINMFKLNTNNQIEVGAPLLIGPLEFAADSGLVSFLDMPITASSPLGTPHGYVMKIDGNNILSTYAESNGSGGINNARVGIGTATPSAKLEITGEASPSLKLTSSSNSAYNVVLQSRLDANHQMSLSALGSEILGRYAANTALITGNVGIGKTNPEYKLDVLGRGKFSDIVTGHTPGTTQKDAFTTVEYIDNFISGEDRPDIIGFWTKNGNNIYNNNSANVGVGISNPGYKLDVNGSINSQVSVSGRTAHANFTAYSPASGYPQAQFLIGQSASDSNIQMYTAPLFSSPGNSKATLIGASTNKDGLDSSAYQVYLYQSQTYASIGTSRSQGTNGRIGTPITIAPNNQEAIRVLVSGNVGIGTANPIFKLDVNGTARFSDLAGGITPGSGQLQAFTTVDYVNNIVGGPDGVGAGTPGQTLVHNGSGWVANSNIYNNGTNVGIGTDSPRGKLDIQNGGTNASLLWNNNRLLLSGSSNPGLFIYNQGAHGWALYSGAGSIGSFAISDETVNKDRFVIRADGTIDLGNQYNAPFLKITSTGVSNFSGVVTGSTPGTTQKQAFTTVEYIDGALTGAYNPNVGVWTKNGNDIYNANTGNVGVGTNNPQAKLDVLGNFQTVGRIRATGGVVQSVQTGGGNYMFTMNAVHGSGPRLQLGNILNSDAFFEIGAWASINNFDSKARDLKIFNTNGSMYLASASGYLGLGTDSPSKSLDVVGTGQFSDLVLGLTPGTNQKQAFTTVEYIDDFISGVTSPTVGFWTKSTTGENIFNANTGNVGIGTNNPGPNKLAIDGGSLSVNGSIKGLGATNYFNGRLGINNPSVGASSLAVFGNAAIGDSYFSVNAPANGLIVQGRLGVGTSTPAEAFHVSGNARIDGGLTLGGDLIMTGNTLVVDKITANTIDPMYTISGIQYSTFASAIVGGVKEEYIGRISKADFKNKGDYYELSMDMKSLKEGSDLWVWYRVIDFSDDNVDVFLSPKGETASMAAYVEGSKIVIRSDKKVDAYMRLIGKRFDWKQWPTKAIEQGQPGGLLID